MGHLSVNVSHDEIKFLDFFLILKRKIYYLNPVKKSDQ